MFTGLRGAIAFALSIHLEFEDEKRYVLVTTTLIIVLFTIMFLGGATMPLMKVSLSPDCRMSDKGGLWCQWVWDCSVLGQVAGSDILGLCCSVMSVGFSNDRHIMMTGWFRSDNHVMMCFLTTCEFKNELYLLYIWGNIANSASVHLFPEEELQNHLMSCLNFQNR